MMTSKLSAIAVLLSVGISACGSHTRSTTPKFDTKQVSQPTQEHELAADSPTESPEAKDLRLRRDVDGAQALLALAERVRDSICIAHGWVGRDGHHKPISGIMQDTAALHAMSAVDSAQSRLDVAQREYNKFMSGH